VRSLINTVKGRSQYGTRGVRAYRYGVYRHFGPKTLRHHRDGSEMSGQFGTGAELSMRQFGTSTEVSVRHFGTSAELSAVRPLFNV